MAAKAVERVSFSSTMMAKRTVACTAANQAIGSVTAELISVTSRTMSAMLRPPVQQVHPLLQQVQLNVLEPLVFQVRSHHRSLPQQVHLRSNSSNVKCACFHLQNRMILWTSQFSNTSPTRNISMMPHVQIQFHMMTLAVQMQHIRVRVRFST